MALPPGPQKCPENLMSSYPEMESLALLDQYHQEFGDIFTLKLNGWASDGKLYDWVMLTTPEMIKPFFCGDLNVLSASRANQILFGEMLPKNGMFALEGERLKKHKRLLMKSLNGERILRYVPKIQQYTRKMVACWEQEEPFNLLKKIHLVTTETILKTVFGMEEGAQFLPLAKSLSKLEDYSVNPEERMAIAGHLHQVIVEETRKRKALPVSILEARDDIFSLLLRAVDREGDGSGLTDEEIVDELFTLLHAGFGSTSTMIAWCFECILSHKEVCKKIQEELDRVLGGGPCEAKHLEKLEYLDAAITEAFRLRPLFMVAGARQLNAPFVIEDQAKGVTYTLPKDTVVANCSYILHRRPELYPDPEHFIPERFLRKKIDPYAWSPFGGGSRRCVGMAFALQEAKVILATVLSRAELEIVAPTWPPQRQGFFFAPRGGPLLKLVRRRID